MIIAMAEKRHFGRYRWHQHSDFWHLTVIVTGPAPLIPVMDWFWHRHFCSLRCRTDEMPDSFAFLKK
jgi:hypothetical protein